MSPHAPITTLAEHPYLGDILAVLARLPRISDEEMAALARAWHNTPAVSEARRTALSPDVPLIVEVLCAFDALAALYADDLLGEADYVRLDPRVTAVGLKAVRDAVAAAYARPVLTSGQHAALTAAWRAVFPVADASEPDLGPASPAIKQLVVAMTVLAGRCHDDDGRRLYDGLAARALTADGQFQQAARRAAFEAAVAGGRRRIWTLVRRSVAESFSRPCSQCRSRDTSQDRRVLAVCLDAACGLLVGDLLDAASTDLLVSPAAHLVPRQRQPGV